MKSITLRGLPNPVSETVYDYIKELEAHVDRLRQDRIDYSNVTCKEGMNSSEWIWRTGKAERQLAEAITKGEDLCQAYGVSLIKIHDLERELARVIAVAEGRETVPLNASTSDALRAVQKVVQSKNAALAKKKK